MFFFFFLFFKCVCYLKFRVLLYLKFSLYLCFSMSKYVAIRSFMLLVGQTTLFLVLHVNSKIRMYFYRLSTLLLKAIGPSCLVLIILFLIATLLIFIQIYAIRSHIYILFIPTNSRTNISKREMRLKHD